MVDFLVWGVTGDEPRPEFPDAYRARHRAAIAAGGYPRPGDVVPHGGELFAVISGVAFNADDDLDVVWAAPLGEDDSVSISRVTSLPKHQLPAPVGQVRNLDGVRHTARWILTGEQ
ncbi:hypothetical protein E1265_34690 [Streptomyces sp. 8K308]|uniref:hypothetical protein n=1 Tax=Streptomyces sp. 8K308 TaxID=2530388 RepID=UPI001042BFB4|nr:hypothetical protein [Streptomyces sp. 8K308]TDC06543.1 hypothetical protein E1265_34690 [Streptomyces sp. 8K308]